MTTTAILATIAAVAVCVGAVLWFRSKQSNKAEMPLTVDGAGVVGYDRTVMARVEAERIARDLAGIRTRVEAKLEYIYGERHECSINQLTLDIHYHKPAEWTGIVARHMTVNPTRPKYRTHAAEEFHNLYRMLAFGINNIYTPMDDDDYRHREAAQAFTRSI